MDSKILLTLIALLGLSTVFINQHSTVGSQDAMIANEFAQWQAKHNIFYQVSEQAFRFAVFRENFLFAEQANAKETGSLRLGMTQFAGMTNEEFASVMVMKVKQPEVETTFESMTYKPLKAGVTFNWADKGAVTHVDNQGQCGSCWAFSTKQSLEGINVIFAKNALTSFSAQQLVSCSKENDGCNGGWPLRAMQYTAQNGIETDSDYPYVNGNGGRYACKYSSSEATFKNKSQVQVRPSNNAAAIQENVTNQPLSILVQAASITWQLYNGGIMTSKSCSTETDHAVLLTGYDTQSTTPYWIVKNSWGASWGISGYCHVEIEKTGPGVCGIQQSSYYPTY